MWLGAIWRRFRRRLRYWRDRGERQRLLWEEMDFHLESMVEELRARGMSEPDARAAAHRKFGNMTHKSEEASFTWIARWINDLAHDLRHAFRGMRRDVGFTIFAVLIAAMGIGAGSTIFSVVNAVLLRPLPFRDPARLVWISNAGLKGAEWTTQVDHFLDLREQNRSLTDMAGYNAFYTVGAEQLTGTGSPERLTAVPVTQNFFRVLGVEPMLGREFTPEECQGKFGAQPAVLLSNRFWQSRFASEPAIVGKKLTLNNRPSIVAGVLPAAFDFPSVFAPGTPADIFIPWPLTAETNGWGNTTKVIGRLKPGISLQAAQAEFHGLAANLEIRHRERNSLAPRLTPLEERVSGQARPALMVLAYAVAVLMSIVCANLSNLQLARMAARRKELAMRAALGAGRWRLARQMLTESVALACCGAALGLVLTLLGTRAVAHLSAFDLPLLASVRLDAQALAFTATAAILSGVLFGSLPAFQIRTFDAQDALKETGRGLSGGRRQQWVRNALVVSEIALASILLVGAGLLIRSFQRALDVDLGFQPERAAALRVDPSFRLPTFDRQNAYIDEMLRKARAVPGIRFAGMTDVLPFGGDRSWGVAGKGQSYPRGKSPQGFIRMVTDGYFEAAGIRLIEGRYFTEQDRATSEKVAIVNQTLAKTLWPGLDAVGQTLTQDGGRRVVGVVADVRHFSVEQAGGGELYMPLRQTSDYSDIELVVRTGLPTEALAKDLRVTLRSVDPNLPVSEFRTLQDLVDKAVSPRRFLALLLAGFAVFALALASLGIYAVVSYSVTQRVQEIGIRMALGASVGDVQKSVLLRTLGLAGAGLLLGTVASRFLATALAGLLFGVTAGDPATFAATGGLLLAVAAFAGFVPAWRASRIDPMTALRSN